MNPHQNREPDKTDDSRLALKGRIMLRSIFAAFALALAGLAQAQTLEESGKLGDFINSASLELSQLEQNLLQMSGAVSADEYLLIDSLHSSIVNVGWYYSTLSLVLQIHSVMKDKRDQINSKKYIGPYAKQAVRAANAAVDIANRTLVKMRTSAVISETQKARDLILKIREEIQRVLPGS